MSDRSANTPRIAVTMGDPAGIGPEIVMKAVERLRPRIERGKLSVRVVGAARCFEMYSRSLELPWHIPAVDEPSDTGAIELVSIGAGETPPAPGRVSADAGRLAYQAIERAVGLCLNGQADAIVTSPLNKEGLNLAGHHYGGHTELLADLTGSRDSFMMLAHGAMRVSHLTTHIPLQEVTARLTPERLRRIIELTIETLERLGIASPRIGIAALNPHAGDGGIFGRQDIDVSAPVIRSFRSEGHDVQGPVPGDTVFVKLRAGQYDAVVAMYHDQGHIPVKLMGFAIDPETGAYQSVSGVNITLGLPIVRTSVDHGTAFDIAGKGVANADSMIEAIDFAIDLSVRRA
ncbi:4-hydroxythreonine-4-phosphate dehydrogenase PdxA [Microbaculum marinum]|uniref:4-hydroxythreonine-4-phosphate dehydrogenase PdxA n=1 Tax=Microbaculum marinum TaxID=1764581 RepID=A0AAW9RE97_9HYPH